MQNDRAQRPNKIGFFFTQLFPPRHARTILPSSMTSRESRIVNGLAAAKRTTNLPATLASPSTARHSRASMCMLAYQSRVAAVAMNPSYSSLPRPGAASNYSAIPFTLCDLHHRCRCHPMDSGMTFPPPAVSGRFRHVEVGHRRDMVVDKQGSPSTSAATWVIRMHSASMPVGERESPGPEDVEVGARNLAAVGNIVKLSSHIPR